MGSSLLGPGPPFSLQPGACSPWLLWSRRRGRRRQRDCCTHHPDRGEGCHGVYQGWDDVEFPSLRGQRVELVVRGGKVCP